MVGVTGDQIGAGVDGDSCRPVRIRAQADLSGIGDVDKGCGASRRIILDQDVTSADGNRFVEGQHQVIRRGGHAVVEGLKEANRRRAGIHEDRGCNAPGGAAVPSAVELLDLDAAGGVVTNRQGEAVAGIAEAPVGSVVGAVIPGPAGLQANDVDLAVVGNTVARLAAIDGQGQGRCPRRDSIDHQGSGL